MEWINNWLRARTEIPVTKPPKFNTMEIVVIVLSIGIILGSFKFGGVFLSSGMMTGFGTVFGFAIVIYKFEFARLMVLWIGRWLDLAILLLSFGMAVTPFGFMAATFTGIFLTAYLALNRYFNERKMYKLTRK